MLQKCMHLFAHLAQNLPGHSNGPGVIRPNRNGRSLQRNLHPASLPAVFQQPVLPRGQVLENPIVIPGVCRVVKNMYGAAKTGAYQVVGIYCRRWPAGAGDRDGTGPCLSPQRRPTQTPGVQAGNPKGHRQEKASQTPPHMPLPHFPFVPCSSIAAAGEKSPQNLSRRWGLFHRAAAHDVHDSRTSLRAGLSHLPKNSKPAGVTCRPAGKEGRWFYCGACVRERPSAGHRRGHARTGAQLPWILYQKLSKKARGKSKINLEKRELPLRAETLCKQRTVKIKLYNIIASSWNAQKIAAHLSCSPACPQTKYTSSKTCIFPGTVLLCSTQPISTT